MSDTQVIYWKAISDLLKWSTFKKNSLILDILYTHKLTFEVFFKMAPSGMKEVFKFSEDDLEALQGISAKIPSIAFEIESLYKQGIEILTINDQAYSNNIKKFLKKYSPTLLYIKGDKALLNEKTIAVVGSREVTEKGISFTKNISKMSVNDGYAISSGYARGT